MERERWIQSAINEVKNPNFFVRSGFPEVGLKRPAVREVADPIERWLAGLDPDEISKLGLWGGPKLPNASGIRSLS
jgi:hypothetical protein